MNVQTPGKDIWTVDGPDLVFLGVTVNTRMTIVRLADGRLWIHSPIELSPDVARWVDDLGGDVAALVAPNKYHYLFIELWREQFPHAQVFAHEALRQKVSNLANATPLAPDVPELYASDLDQVLFAGNRLFQEAVFYHRASGSAIFTDLVQNLSAEQSGWLPSLYLRLDGVAAPKGGVPRLYKWFSTRRRLDREAFRRVQDWAPSQVLFCHGEPLQEDAETFLRREFGYLD